MSFLPRQKIRPGLGGYSPRPIDPSEARALTNVIQTRDGVWKSRPGLVKRAAFSNSVFHVSNLSTQYLVIVEGGNLRTVNLSGYANTLRDTGWPTSGYIRHAYGGNTSNALYWLAYKATAGSSTGSSTLGKIIASTAYSTISGAPTSSWIESYRGYNFAINGHRLRYSVANSSDSWPALNEVYVPRSIGFVTGLFSLNDDQMYILGTNGMGMLTGASESTFTLTGLNNLVLPSYGQTAVQVGNRIACLGPQSKLFLLNPAPERFDLPIEDDLDDVGDQDFYSAWYDKNQNCYCFSHQDSNETWFFDLEKQRWIGKWSVPLVGIGNRGLDTHPRNDRFYGYNTALVQVDPDYTTFTDAGTAFTCTIQTAQDYLQQADGIKETRRLFLDGAGTWTVKVIGRDNPEAAWNTKATVTNLSAPAWASFAAHSYRERYYEFTGTAASTLFLRGVMVEERVFREAN